MQIEHRGQGGFGISTDGTVSHVEPDGPADRAGLNEADLIVGVGDATNEGLWKKPFLGVVGAGKTQMLLVERDGQSVVVEVVWESHSRDAKRSQVVESTVTAAFLGLGLWALFASGKAGGLLLAVFGLAYGMANFRGPSFGLPDEAI